MIDTGTATGGLAEFQSARPRLFGIAYRILGSATDAEDVLQETWIHWQGADRTAVRNPTAFLSTITTRLALNAATSARARRVSYVGPWLPEPVLTGHDPALGAERAEAVELGLLMLLQRLTPNERAAFLLREAFDYPHGEIADILGTSEANARQLARRARAHVDRERAGQVPAAEHDRLLRAFLAAARTGDLDRLKALLSEDVVFYSDGGGVVSAARRPVTGRDQVARFLAGVMRKLGKPVSSDLVNANGREAFTLARGDSVLVLGAIDAAPSGVRRVYFVRNPAKLGAVRPPS
ncbi:RNA polymerase sigma-70 factor [Actinorugispora endophytica]|uniref:RNA polymerase sigma-70 factor (ECF subfamily) n=1 Tax=Actinorugispora endophytica TaxID=1605990 RepID=A0A4R6V0K4_9ACTN|nr:RNA polymerase sigma-70 factor [Actinorugispora endophytica]TDQ53273.1 RNA polymerase sigma-70 factor (ECF subfamily) [Actinorugispora endophytica]